MAFFAWVARFLGGFNILSRSEGPARIGKMIFYGIIAAIVFLPMIAGYHKLTQPTTRIIVKEGGNLAYSNNEDKNKYQFFGCTAGHIRIGGQWKW